MFLLFCFPWKPRLPLLQFVPVKSHNNRHESIKLSCNYSVWHKATVWFKLFEHKSHFIYKLLEWFYFVKFSGHEGFAEFQREGADLATPGFAASPGWAGTRAAEHRQIFDAPWKSGQVPDLCDASAGVKLHTGCGQSFVDGFLCSQNAAPLQGKLSRMNVTDGFVKWGH